MDSVLDQIGEWLKELLVSGIMNQLTGLFDSVNTQVGDIATQVGTTPANFSPGVFAMIRNVSESVIIPVAGLILTFIACYELIQMIIDHNNLANFETWIFFKWVFKTFVAVTLITNTFNAKRANETGSIYAEDIQDLQNRQNEIWEIAKEILARLATIQ